MRVHPLTGESKNGKPINGSARPVVEAHFERLSENRRAQLSYDAARSGTDLDEHWAYSDALDADSSNSQQVRHALIRRQRYEAGSNGYYAGIVRTHCNMLVGVGPTLRMLTNNRIFNQLVEREFYAWAQRIQLRRKLWSMAHARTGDGETFAVLQTNPALDGVQLDFLPIEAEQCQTPMLPWAPETGYIDGVRFDEFGNVLWYDVLPTHPGSGRAYLNSDPVRVPPQNVLHWFKLERPGSHRGIPELTSTLNLGAWSRRFREATCAAAETAADFAAISTTTHSPDSDTAMLVAPFTGVPMPKRTWAFNPMGWDISQLKAEHPGTTYDTFVRQQISEMASPLSQPYNLAAHDSSTYSFASGKLDTLAYRAALDVERQDCNDLVLDRLFAAWFREWTIIAERRDFPPSHQWDWPQHPVIDEVSHANATQTKLATGETTFRQVCSDNGTDAEDQYTIMAEDMFGEATDETIAKVRQIVTLKNTPAHAVQYVAQLLGIQTQPDSTGAPANDGSQAV